MLVSDNLRNCITLSQTAACTVLELTTIHASAAITCTHRCALDEYVDAQEAVKVALISLLSASYQPHPACEFVSKFSGASPEHASKDLQDGKAEKTAN